MKLIRSTFALALLALFASSVSAAPPRKSQRADPSAQAATNARPGGPRAQKARATARQARLARQARAQGTTGIGSSSSLQLARAPQAPFGATLLSESFDTGIPAGWAVLDNAGSGVIWDDLAGCGESGNFTGSAGDLACASSDLAGVLEYDTELRTPIVDLSGSMAPAILTFNANFQVVGQGRPRGGPELLEVDVSTNGAAGPWVNLLSWTENHGAFRATPGEPVVIDIASVTGQANVMFRFHYYNPTLGDFDWYAQVDDVVVQAQPIPVGCTLICPQDVVVGNDPGLCAATVNYPPPTTQGQCGTISCAPPSGGSFPVGSTLITCTESPPDLGEGLLGPASCTFNVAVNDVEPPVITCAADQDVTLPQGQTTVVVNFPAPTATDNCTNPPPASCAPPSGSSFAAGTTPVTCTATDAASNSSSCGLNVNVSGGQVSVLEIPTASSIGLAGLALLLAGAGMLALRRSH